VALPLERFPVELAVTGETDPYRAVNIHPMMGRTGEL